jgi:hypothetical protein
MNIESELIDLFYKHINNFKEYIKKYIDSLDKIKNINIYHKSKLLNKSSFELDTLLKKIKDSNICNLLTSYSDINDNQLYYMCSYFRLVIILLMIKSNIMVIDSKTKLKNTGKSIMYIINVADTSHKLKLFTMFLLVYYMESKIAQKNKKKYYACFDFEFTYRKIKLMQSNFETLSLKGKYTNSYIWIINPTELDNTMHNILIKNLMTTLSIHKIVHGSESLDIPYLYNELFKKNKKIINKFTRNLTDTRYLCEYYKICTNGDKICGMYDLLPYFETITNESFKQIDDIDNKLGPVQDRTWDIHNLSSFHIQYALYDVLFLKHLILDIYIKAKKNAPQYYKSFRYIPIITRYILIEKQNISDIGINAKKEIDPINNYHIKSNNLNITLITIFNYVLQELFLPELETNINLIVNINYFKANLINIIKKIIYYLIIENFTVYINKNTTFNNKLTLNNIYEVLHYNKFNSLVKLFKSVEKKSSIIIKNKYK